MASFLTAMSTWNHREASSLKEVSKEKIKFQRALDAEDDLGAIVANLGHLSDHIHLRKRIFVPEQNRSREIDVIAVCSALYVVEVKNWSGKVWRNGNRWFQLPMGNSAARTLEFNDVLGEVEYKAKALVRFLQKNGVEVPPGSVKAVVVFSSERCELCPTTIANHPSIFTKKTFQETVERRSVWADTLTNIAPMFFAGRNEIIPSVRRQINVLLAEVRTWDVLITHNGERHQGDLKWIRLPEYTDWQHHADRDPHLNVQRADIVSAKMVWSSKSWWGILGAMWQGTAGHLQLVIQPKVRLLRPAEKQRLAKQAAKDAKKAAHGGGPKPGPRAAPAAEDLPPGVHQVPLTAKSGNRKTAEVNHVVFHPAGQTGPMTFPLSEVAILEVFERGPDERR
jgi:hypothetical protein